MRAIYSGETSCRDPTYGPLVPNHGPSMRTALARLFQLRPFLTSAIIGIPVVLLIAIGVATVLTLKFLFFIVLPIGLVVWLLRKIFRRPPAY